MVATLPITLLQFNGNYTFNGTNGLFYGALPSVLSDYFSISLWIQTTATSVDLVSYGRNYKNFDGEFELKISATGCLTFYDYNRGYGFIGFDSTRAVNTGIRTNVVFIKNYTTAYYYINGALSGSQTISTSSAKTYANSDFNFGSDPRDMNFYFVGVMSDMSIYNLALSSAQVGLHFRRQVRRDQQLFLPTFCILLKNFF